MMYLHTGNNEPLTKQLLNQISQDLTRNRGCRILNDSWKDSFGIAALKIIQDNQTAYAVGRSTEEFFDKVSTQKALLEKIRCEDLPLVMLIKDGYSVFDPLRILTEFGNTENLNNRFGQVMVNFPSGHGWPWFADKTLESVWVNVRGGTLRWLQAHPKPMTLLDFQKETPT